MPRIWIDWNPMIICTGYKWRFKNGVFRPKIPQPKVYRCTMMRCHQQLNIQNCSCNCPFPLWKLSCSWFPHILRENGRKLCGFCIRPTFIYLILLPSHLLFRSEFWLEFSNNTARISWSEFQLEKQIEFWVVSSTF